MSVSIVSISPATGEVLGSVAATDPALVTGLVASARAAQHEWGSVGPVQRSRRISSLGTAIRGDAEELSRLIATEVGKPISEARAEVARAADICTYLGGVGQELGGILRRSSDPNVAILARQVPVGVVGVITPWNFPVAIPTWKIAPALVAGCAVLWKPSRSAALTAMRLAELFGRSGLPEGILTCLFGGEEIGGALVEAPLDALSFTGSTSVGSRIRRQVGGGVRPRLTLELGGVNVAHVLADADLSRAARDIALAAYGYAGQKCTATRVIAVDRSVADDLADALRAEVEALPVGDPLDPGTVVGPVIDVSTAEGVRTTVQRLGAAAQLLARGGTPSSGAYIPPTLYRDRSGSSALLRTEIFGPIATLVATDSMSDHLRLARLSGTALTAAVYGTDLDWVRAMLNVVGTGVVAINRPSTGLDPHVPFGGWGESGGHFSEQGMEGLRFYLKWQTIYWRSDAPASQFP